jgi:putative ABC transport system ATP-binding protein
LLKDPDILILDEATSALDAESETLVNQALAALLRGHNTTISIAHRLSTIKRSDRIIVIGSDGTVADEGSYKELSEKSNGAFNKLMEWQLSGEGGDGNVVKPRPSQAEEIEYSQHEETNQEEEEVSVIQELSSKVTNGSGKK